MTVSDTIRGLLAMAGKKQNDLAEALGLSSRQAMSNKIKKNSWYASDVIKAAELCGCRLAFVMPDGEHIYIRDDDENQKIPDA